MASNGSLPRAVSLAVRLPLLVSGHRLGCLIRIGNDKVLCEALFDTGADRCMVFNFAKWLQTLDPMGLFYPIDCGLRVAVQAGVAILVLQWDRHDPVISMCSGFDQPFLVVSDLVILGMDLAIGVRGNYVLPSRLVPGFLPFTITAGTGFSSQWM